MLRIAVFWACNGTVCQDMFQFLCKIDTEPHVVSKRVILSEVAKLFDPLGLLGPVIVIAKLILQDLWQLTIQWMAVLQDIHTRWIALRTQMSNLNQLKIPRCIKFNVHQPIVEVHGICDASHREFGACIYLRTKLGLNDHHSKLLCSKSRVAQNRFVTAIKAIGRFTIGALNQ